MNKIINYLIVSLVLSSCSISATEDMWSHKEHYYDKFDKFLISDEAKQVIFLGKKYHYIFDDNDGEIRSG